MDQKIIAGVIILGVAFAVYVAFSSVIHPAADVIVHYDCEDVSNSTSMDSTTFTVDEKSCPYSLVLRTDEPIKTSIGKKGDVYQVLLEGGCSGQNSYANGYFKGDEEKVYWCSGLYGT